MLLLNQGYMTIKKITKERDRLILLVRLSLTRTLIGFLIDYICYSTMKAITQAKEERGSGKYL